MSLKINKKLVVLGTGGTIAGTAATAGDNIGYTAAQVGVAQLLLAIPALAQMPCVLVSEQVAQIDSKDMSHAVWQALAERASHFLAQPDVQGIVITHGTDTLEETAYFLHAVLPAPLLAAKPVVLTCAMRPASAMVPDGPQNLLDACAVALTPGAAGVVAVCAGSVHGAVDVQKQHTYRVDAFSSGDSCEGSILCLYGSRPFSSSTLFTIMLGCWDSFLPAGTSIFATGRIIIIPDSW